MTDFANIDGRLVPREQAWISAFDRGFLYGDSVYETIRTYGGRPFLVRRHLSRLAASAERLQLRLPNPLDEIAERVRSSVDASGNAESLVRVILSRGASAIGLDPTLAKHPTLVMLISAFQPLPAPAYEGGIQVQLATVVRNPIQALDPRIKTSNQLNNILAFMEAKAANCTEAFMLNAAGELAEGTTSNIFVVQGRRLITPPLGAGILEGITRELVLELAAREGIEAREDSLRPEDLFQADECFLTATTKEILPVVRVSGRVIGSGRPGPVSLQLLKAYRSRVQTLLETE
ncbi:MAG TPA: aminotransferase class IV [Acidobacteriota bacterium]